MNGTTTSSAKLGSAMIALAASRADHFKEQRDGAVFEAYWRGDDKVTVKVYAASGAWHDAKTGESGGGRAFAALHGLSLAEMMKGTASVSPSREAATEAPPVPPLVDPAAIWRYVRSDAIGLGIVRAYLSDVRGITEEGTARIEGRFGGVDVGALASTVALPALTRWQIVGGGGSALAVPLVTPGGDVANVAFRFTRPAEDAPKCATLPGLPVGARDAPIGFGDMHALATAGIVIVVEGLMDTLTARSILGSSAAVIGAHSVGQLSSSLPHWLPALSAPHAEIVVVPHVDPCGVGEAHAVTLTAALIARGKRARLFRWAACLEALGVPEAALRTSITDITDLLRIAAQERVAAAVRCGLGVAP